MPVSHTKSDPALKKALHRAERRARTRAFLLVLPLFLFILAVFVLPIFLMLIRSVENPEVPTYLPETSRLLRKWDGQSEPGEALYAALVSDMREAEQKGLPYMTAARRVNKELPGTTSNFNKARRKLDELQAPYRQALIEVDSDFAKPDMFLVLKRESSRYTLAYYLEALDFFYDESGKIQQKDPGDRIYRKYFFSTAWMSALITIICVLLAYPVSYLLATLPLRISNLLMILVLLPFWTSLLVRISAWIVLLQTQGVINDLITLLPGLGDDDRIRMIYNRTGTIVTMVHILLPFMILPLYAVMKGINPSYLRAARSLGANFVHSWWTVYFPLTLPGLFAGVILVFILSIGYYITPALVGGESGIFISNFVADYINSGATLARLGAALATLLLVAVLLLYWLFSRFVGLDRLRFA